MCPTPTKTLSPKYLKINWSSLLILCMGNRPRKVKYLTQYNKFDIKLKLEIKYLYPKVNYNIHLQISNAIFS